MISVTFQPECLQNGLSSYTKRLPVFDHPYIFFQYKAAVGPGSYPIEVQPGVELQNFCNKSTWLFCKNRPDQKNFQ